MTETWVRWGADANATADRPRLVPTLVTLALVAAGVAVRSRLLFGFVVLVAIFVPMEKLFALHPRRLFRKGWATDLVHFFVTNMFITAGFLAAADRDPREAPGGRAEWRRRHDGRPLFAALNALFIHSNVRLRLGPLRWVITTPEFHHSHHANEPEALNKNFAGGLPVLDVLFGTAYLPKDRLPVAYGIDEPVPGEYLTQLTFPFRATQRRLHRPGRRGEGLGT